MKTVQQILNAKPVQIFSVTENSSVLEALQLMMEKRRESSAHLDSCVL